MKILSLSTYDIKGGAARAAYRLHQGLNEISTVESVMLSQIKYSQDVRVFGNKSNSGIDQAKTGLRLTADQLPLKKYRQREKQLFSPHWLPSSTVAKIANHNPDLVNLHWISAGYVTIEDISKINYPLVWTLHDMWSFTGGCHYNQDCNKFTVTCGACPQLRSDKTHDIAHKIWHRKQKAWQNLKLTIVTPSHWLAKAAQSSMLFREKRIEVIPYGLDISTYRPIERDIARNILKLPSDKYLVLFLALSATSDTRKGFQLLQPALQQLSQTDWQDKIELMVVGASKPEPVPELGFPSHYLGTLSDDTTLALAYSAADVFVAPSIQDNLPNTVLEAIACGTPCVAFDIGGMPDMIEHEKTGYLAQPYKTEDLQQGISWVLEDHDRYLQLSIASRRKAEQEFALPIQAQNYQKLYQEILQTT